MQVDQGVEGFGRLPQPERPIQRRFAARLVAVSQKDRRGRLSDLIVRARANGQSGDLERPQFDLRRDPDGFCLAWEYRGLILKTKLTCSTSLSTT